MNIVNVTSLSSKGQIVIPTEIRKEMKLSAGVKLMVFTDGSNLLLKPIETPKLRVFKDMIKKSRKYAKAFHLKKKDVLKAIKNVRDENRP